MQLLDGRSACATTVLAIVLIVVTGPEVDGRILGKDFQQPFTPLDNMTFDVSQVAGHARTASSDARSTAQEVIARESADIAEQKSFGADSEKDLAEFRDKSFKGGMAEGKKQEAKAAAAAAAAKMALEAGKILSKAVIKEAGVWASQHTEDVLADPMLHFQDWKFAVLHDPASEAKKAAQKAAAPYEKALRVLERRIAEYSQRAVSLQSEAYALQNKAKAAANSAVEKQAGEDYTGAAKQMMTAHTMMAQAGMFGSQAIKYEEAIAKMSVPLPAYTAAAQMKAAIVAHRYNPDGYAPPPVSKNAFNPPPPPTSFGFFQRKSEMHRIQGPSYPAIG